MRVVFGELLSLVTAFSNGKQSMHDSTKFIIHASTNQILIQKRENLSVIKT